MATTSVRTISISATLDTAVKHMIGSEHRNIVVISDHGYKNLNVHDVLRVKHSNFDMNATLERLNLQLLPTIQSDSNILDALEFLQSDSELIAVLNEDATLYGIVTHSDIISSIDPDTLMDNYRLRDFVKGNKNNRWVESDENSLSVMHDMGRYLHESAMVLEDRKPVGIVTTEDILRLIQQKSDLSLPISAYMSQPVQTLHHESTIKQALQFMKDKHFKRIVTVDNHGKLIGVITQRELVAITYSRWAVMMKEYQEELSEINKILEKKSEKYERIAGTDPLTGLYNRMKFMELYISEYTVMKQRHNTMSMMIVDLDHFKNVNDSYGHNIGDKVLKQTSNILLQSLRNVDILCRWGGEEFVALLPTATADQAFNIADQIRQALEDTKHDNLPQVTASFGVTEIIEDEDIEATIARADKALYEAKDAGRNCVLRA
ncbi:MAG: diguanylate cyclase [Campylobacterota bacterium]|nr:diguanylate cyclase [Campylobacterota bacterium]